MALVLGTLAVFALARAAIHAPFMSAGGISAAEQLSNLGEDFLNHALIALLMLAIIGGVRSVAAQRGWRRWTALAAAVAVAATLAVGLRSLQMASPPEEFWLGAPNLWLRYALIAGLLTAVGEIYRHEVQSLEAMHRAELDHSALERETAQARLQVLQAQIEPHFLFNTLANVRRLYEVDAAGGQVMLDDLMRYLEVALPTMREERSTLEREASLIDAYLKVQRVRMGRRLGFTIDIAPSLRSLEVPPMMLLTLVENAVKHGLAPLREGGSIEVAAALDGQSGRLALSVADDGGGFGSASSGGGTGLANIRARLAAMFGDAARLSLTPNAPRGLRALIELPAPAS